MTGPPFGRRGRPIGSRVAGDSQGEHRQKLCLSPALGFFPFDFLVFSFARSAALACRRRVGTSHVPVDVMVFDDTALEKAHRGFQSLSSVPSFWDDDR